MIELCERGCHKRERPKILFEAKIQGRLRSPLRLPSHTIEGILVVG